jgi:hypothetical protein
MAASADVDSRKRPCCFHRLTGTRRTLHGVLTLIGFGPMSAPNA